MINGKKVLLVMGGAAQLCDIVENAKNMAYYVIVTDYLENSPAKRIADESCMVSITDVDGIVELCKSKHVDGIMNYCLDPGQKPYYRVCQKLGFKCYGIEEQFNIMTNKDVFKKECSKYGVATIPGFDKDGIVDDEVISSIIYPVVVKPADGRASKGSSKCNNRDELNKAIEKALAYSDRKKIVIEKFLPNCQEVVIKYCICDGEVFFTSMADLYTCYTKDGERAYIGSQTFPSRYYQLYEDKVDQRVRAMIKGMGIQNGAMSFDGFVDGDEIRFFDPSFRMGGAQDWRIVDQISGVNISSLLTNFAMTGKMGNVEDIRKVDKAFMQKRSAMLYFLCNLGTIGQIDGLDEAEKVDSVIGYHLSHEVGDCITQFGTSDHVVIRFLMVADTKEKLKEDIIQVQNVFHVLDENGEDMLLPNFDVNLF